MHEEYLTVHEVARILRVSPNNVYMKAKSGELPCVRFGHRVLISSDELSRVINDCTDRKKISADERKH